MKSNFYRGRISRGGVLTDAETTAAAIAGKYDTATAETALAGKLDTTATAADTNKVKGAAVSGTAAAGEVLAATAADACRWASAVGTQTAVKTSAYTAAVGELVLADTSTTWALTTPAAAAGAWFRAKKVTSDTNALTVTPATGTVDGAETLDVTAAYASKTFFCDGTNWWSVS